MGLNGLNINNVVRWEVLSDLRNGVPSHGRGGRKGTKGIKEEQSSSDGAGDDGNNVLWVFSFIWLWNC